MKSIYELTADDVQKYMDLKGIKTCPLCREGNFSPLSWTNKCSVYSTVNYTAFNDDVKKLEPRIDTADIPIVCDNCGNLQRFAPGIIIRELGLTEGWEKNE